MRTDPVLAPPEDATGRKNMLQLIQLRWIAVVGQVVTIASVRWLFGIELPLVPMAMLLAFLVLLNIASLLRLKARASVSNGELLLALVLDVLALTGQLYLSGGATNPFISLYLLQVTLSAVLLEAWSTWVMVVMTGVCFAGLIVIFRPLELPHPHLHDLFKLHIRGTLVCFVLDAALLVVFVVRIGRNLRARDARLADMRQQAAEEDHIVRMGLLASGAAHELGTPLATLSVILNDWRRMPVLAADAELLQELDEMEAEVQRCKAIVTGVLMSAGEARGEAPVVTTVKAFLDDIVQDWRATRQVAEFAYDNAFGDDLQIVSDSALKQVICNVLDNAADASPRWISFSATREDEALVLAVRDAGQGFAPEMLANLGKPYHSTKGRLGGGLGLFLVFNVLRKLGGGVAARNRAGGGAAVTLTLPLAALALDRGSPHAG
ncbi:ATP-binding protein [Caulobacter sp. S45]|uniref:ATP-binding protein n=1 Tax=Caulobacter sp. S45 TaxID=1641861 RepID=UPI001C202EA6|nr:ATP-binding protein [Caulobacter sp. S45]